MSTRTAVVLAAGLGTRMRQSAEGAVVSAEQAAVAGRGLKAMIPVGRPFLDYVLSGLADAGIERVCLVVSPDHALIAQRYRSQVIPTRFELIFAVQASPRGTADAVLAAAPVVGLLPFLVVNSDNLYPAAALTALGALDSPGLIGYQRDALIRDSNIEPERIARYALLWADPAGWLTRIVEKPDPGTAEPLGALVSMNSWRFGPAIFEACRSIGPSNRGELEIQDAVAFAGERLGERFRVVPFAGGVLDLSHQGDIAEVARRVRGIEVRL